MYKSGKLKKSNALTFKIRLGIAAFVLGTGVGYSITDDKSPTEQFAALSAHVKNVLFANHQPVDKKG